MYVCIYKYIFKLHTNKTKHVHQEPNTKGYLGQKLNKYINTKSNSLSHRVLHLIFKLVKKL